MKPLPLVFVHGFMGGAKQWELQKPIADNGRELITPNLPGFSDNAHLSAPDTISGFAGYVLDELTRMKVDRFMLLGHSMGGMIVQEMTAMAPDRIEKLILYGTASTGNLPGRFETFETSKQRAIDDGVSKTARRISSTWFLEYEAAAEFENCAAIAEQSSPQALQAALDAMSCWSRTDDLEKIPCPTLIIWGEKDRTYRWPQVEKVWKTIPQVSLCVLPGCSHAVHLEKPEIFNAVLRDFIDGNSTA